MGESLVNPVFRSSTETPPTLWKTYFVMVNGVKNIMSMAEILKWYERNPNDSFLWLDMKESAITEVHLMAVNSKIKQRNHYEYIHKETPAGMIDGVAPKEKPKKKYNTKDRKAVIF